MLAGDQLITATIGPYGEAVALWAPSPEPGGRPHAQWGPVLDAVPARPVAARVTVHWPDPVAVVNIRTLDLPCPLVQPLPAGRILIVSGRCQWRATGPDRNARVYNPDGDLAAAGTFGDGVSHLLSTPAGDVWAGYRDGGVFGGYGWGGPGPEPIGSGGLVRFSGELAPTWRFAGPGPYGDCRALNVTGQSVWFSSLPEYPVVQVTDESVRSWRNSVGGVRALMVDSAQCALVGGYDTDADRIVIGALWDEFVPQRESVLVLPDGATLPPDARLVARGHVLNVFTGTQWFKVDTELFGA